jgi:hypothetical protein
MSVVVCLAANTLHYASGGGHRWAYLNWALGLRAAGCEVIWFEAIEQTSDAQLERDQAALLTDLRPYGLAGSVAFHDQRTYAGGDANRDLDRIGDIDLLLTLSYGAPDYLLRRARRRAMIDIDPGLTQLWMRAGYMDVPEHDVYFSIGEASRPGGRGLPDCGIDWQFTPQCVALEAWPTAAADANSPYTTVSHWWADTDEDWLELGGRWIENTKRAGFNGFIELPSRTDTGLELALGGLESEGEARRLRSFGWSVRDAWGVASSTESYRSYIRASRGEFSCAKPSTVELGVGWISDRTLCYLASGKPAVVQDTGPLELPDPGRGLLRFRTIDEAVDALAQVELDYELHCAAARSLAESRFDARAVATRLLELALP